MNQRLGRQTLRGIGLTVGASIVTSCAGLLSQVVLGRYLSKESFAVYAIALSWATFAIALRSAGAQQILIRSGPRFMEDAAPMAGIARVINLALFASLGFIGVAISAYRSDWMIVALMICIGLYLPLGTYSPIFLAKLAVDSRFGEIARINSVSAIARSVAAIVFAVLGLGAASLALPFVVVAAVEWLMGKRATALVVHSRAPTPAERRNIFGQSKWIMFGRSRQHS